MKTQEQTISDIKMIKTLLADAAARLKEAKKLADGFQYDANMHHTQEICESVMNMVSNELTILNYYYQEQ